MGGEILRLRRQTDRDNNLARFQHAVPFRRIPRWAVKHFERNFAPPCSAFDFDNGVERDQRYAEIRRVCRDAVLAPPQDGMKPVVATTGVTARTAFAFIAGARDVVEVCATCPLQEIAADRGSVAKLRGRAGQKRLGHRRKASSEVAIVREVGVAEKRSDSYAAVGKVLNVVEVGKMTDV